MTITITVGQFTKTVVIPDFAFTNAFDLDDSEAVYEKASVGLVVYRDKEQKDEVSGINANVVIE